MSEFHPNRTKQIRTRPKLTARRIIECWPLLVWIGVLFIAYKLYSGGVQFTRMNGAVDVYQENIAPTHDGRLLKLHVKRGERVAPGTLLAEMDASGYRLELESLKRDIIADRIKDIRSLDFEIIKLQSDMREVQTAEAEDSTIIKEFDKIIAEQQAAREKLPPQYRNLPEDSSVQRARLDLIKAKGRNAISAQHSSEIQETLKHLQDDQKLLIAQKDAATAFDPLKDDIAKLSTMLRADEYQRFVELNNKISLCQLKTDRGGIVDRVAKEVGEYVKVGEGVLKIVGDPEHILCFLPQDQSDDLKKGRPVWVVSTSKKDKVYKSEVIGVAPRINNLADVTSPLPNRRVHGRDVLVKYPDEARNADGSYQLLPGQTVIIHTSEPGNPNLLDTVFHNDDNDKVR